MKLYQYPNCSSCRKAAKFLTEHGVAFASINIVEQPPSMAELTIMLNCYDGNIRKLFNTSGVQYRELNMKEKLPSLSNNEAINLLAGNGKLIKRPFLLTDDAAGVVGFKEEVWAEFVK